MVSVLWLVNNDGKFHEIFQKFHCVKFFYILLRRIKKSNKNQIKVSIIMLLFRPLAFSCKLLNLTDIFSSYRWIIIKIQNFNENFKKGSWNISKNSRNLWNFQTWKFHPTSLLMSYERYSIEHQVERIAKIIIIQSIHRKEWSKEWWFDWVDFAF